MSGITTMSTTMSGQQRGWGLRILHVVTATATVLTFAAVATVGLASAFGWFRVLPVRTGSMTPYAPQGSAVVVQPRAATQVAQGDVIVFNAPEPGRPLVVHRVHALERRHGAAVVTTKGDANDAPDPWQFRIRGNQVWVVTHVVPHAGEVLLLMDTAWVRMAVLVGGAILVLLMGFGAIWSAPAIRWRAPEPEPIKWRAPWARRSPIRTVAGALRTAGVPVGAAVPGAVVLLTLLFVGLPALALFTSVPTAPTPVLATGVLNAPSPLSCRWTGATNLQLTWTNTSPGFATGYKMLRSNTSGSGYAQIGTTSGEASTTGNDTNPLPPTVRYYVVQSTKSTWTSASSNEKAGNTCAEAVNLLAGNGTAGFSGDDGAATSAMLNTPTGVATDSNGNVYIADQLNNRIRKVTSGGTITTFVGGGANAACSFSGSGTSVALSSPGALTVDSSNNLYISDTGNNCVRKVTSGGTVSRVAGGGATSGCTFSGSATSAILNQPNAVAIDSSGNIFVSDTGNNCIRKVTSGGTISRFAGGGASTGCSFSGTATSATLATPYGVAVDSSNNLYIADSANNCIRKVTSAGAISLYAGGGANTACSFSGSPTSVSLLQPTGLAASGSRVFIGDSGRSCVRDVTSGTISLTAGTGTASYSGDGGPAVGATFNVIAGLAVETDGDLVIVDYNNDRVRRVVTP